MQDKDTLCDANHFIKGLQPLNSIVGLRRHWVVLLHPLNGTNSGPRDVQGPQASSFGKITRQHPYTLLVSNQSRPTASLFGVRPQNNLRSRCFSIRPTPYIRIYRLEMSLQLYIHTLKIYIL